MAQLHVVRGPAPTGRLLVIDALRGAAALAVVVHHAVNAGLSPPASAAWSGPVSQVAELGRLGVPLFFVLSGFCIHGGWARAKATGQCAAVPFLPFWRRRLWRLFPPYLLALALALGLVAAASLARPDLALQHYPTPWRGWLGVDFLLHASMLHGLSPTFDRLGGNPPFWTLAREEYLYLLYFPLLAARRRFGPLRAVAGVGLVGLAFPLAFRPFLPEDSAWWGVIESSAPALWLQWALGLLGAEATWGLVRLPPCSRDLRLVPLWLLGALGAEALAPVALAPILRGLACFTLVNGLVQRERAGQLGEARWVRRLAGVGGFSYSLYLVHHPVRGLVKRLLEGWIIGGQPVAYAAAIALVVLAGVASGRLYFELVERHFLADRRPSPRARVSLSKDSVLSR